MVKRPTPLAKPANLFTFQASVFVHRVGEVWLSAVIYITALFHSKSEL